jgi:hypothetical protein
MGGAHELNLSKIKLMRSGKTTFAAPKSALNSMPDSPRKSAFSAG